MVRSVRSFGIRRIAVLLVVGLVALGVRAVATDPYRVTLVVPTADQSFVGGSVLMRGHRVGKVSEIGVLDGRATVEVEIDADHAPLPSGTTARIVWESVLGARVVELDPGDSDAAPLRSGQLVTGNSEAVDVDDLLATLDEPTRAALKRLLGRLDATLGSERSTADLNQMITEAGPTVQALGQLMQSIGQDGPALRRLVTQLADVTGTVAKRDEQLAATVDQLDVLARSVASERDQLSQTLASLPGTVASATSALEGVPGPAANTGKLLDEIEPATARLPEISALARQVLVDARPALELLPGTLRDADRLLQVTPALLGEGNALLPEVDEALQTVNPMIDFLRPYTPELVGWLSNWNGVFGSRDAVGHYARALITTSASAVDNLPAVPIGLDQEQRPQPGSLVDQPWTDAHGDGLN